jgi:hypothetical protein
MSALLLAVLLFAGAATAFQLCALSNAYKPTLSDTCQSAGGAAQAAIHAARGEVEGAVVLLDNLSGSGGAVGPTVLQVAWDAGAAPGGVALSGPFLVTYVHTQKSPRYGASATGWYADGLLPWPPGGAPLGTSQLTAWVNFAVSSAAAPGTYTGSFSTLPASAAPLPFALTVYAAEVPPLGESPFSTVYAFDSSALTRSYSATEVDLNATKYRFLDALAALRFPSINIYASAPLPIEEYKYLAAQGVKVLIMADISGLPFGEGGVAPYAPRGRSFFTDKGSAPASACPTFSPSYISKMVAFLQPTWDALSALNLQHLATVYGFDEIDPICEPSVRQLFAAAKAAFPGVRTLSAIDWPSVPLDLPLDVQVLQYQLVNRSITDPWVAAGHELYTCVKVEPFARASLYVNKQSGAACFTHDVLSPRACPTPNPSHCAATGTTALSPVAQHF